MFLTKIKAIIEYIKPKSRAQLEEEYLSASTDLADLERRIKRLENPNLKHWV